VYFVNQADQTVDESLLQTYMRGCADVEQALGKENIMGGLAQMPRVVSRSFSAVGGEVWSIVDIEISLYRTYGQPNG